MTIAQTFNLAIERHRAGANAEAADLYRQIITQQPDHAEAHYQLGCILHGQEKLDESFKCFEKALLYRPGSAQAMIRLAEVLHDAQQVDPAMDYCRRALVAAPDNGEAYHTLGMILRAKGELDAALSAYTQALRFKPELFAAEYNIGNIYYAVGQLDQAILAYQRSVAIKRDWPPARNNLGGALCAAGRFDEAIAIYQESIRLAPDFAATHWNLGMVYLRKGDFARGWPEYEWRWRVKQLNLAGGRSTQPEWTGDDLRGRRTLLYGEQGFGDVIQCARYIPEVARRGGEVILVCPRELMTLLKNDGDNSRDSCNVGRFVREWVAVGDTFPQHDVHMPLMSMARISDRPLQSSPSDVPYIQAETRRVEQWRARLAGDDRIKIGLAWAGRSLPDPLRSMRLEQLAPLAKLPGIRWISLHKGESSEQAKTPPPEMDLADWTSDFHDFADTAALMENLDLIISVDTGVAHLAGAMGKTVWTMLPLLADWRWFLNRNDSPWYPTMRLFRQKRPRDWETVIANIGEELKTYCVQRRSTRGG